MGRNIQGRKRKPKRHKFGEFRRIRNIPKEGYICLYPISKEYPSINLQFASGKKDLEVIGIYIKSGKPKKTIELTGNIFYDINSKGEPIYIEILI